MTPINEAVLKMVLASPVGKAMSPADQDALRAALETTDARDVGGWLGDQIRKAATVAKGDFEGHPFRGNQWSDASGVGAGGASGKPPKQRGSRDLGRLGRPSFSTMFSDKGNAAVERAFAKWAKTADFSRSPSELTLEFMRTLEGPIETKFKEALDTAVREEVREKVNAIRDELGHDSPQKRDDEARAEAAGKKAKAAEYRRIQAERAAAEQQRRIDSGEVRVLDKEAMKEPLTGEAKTTYNSVLKKTKAAIEQARDAIAQIREMSGKIGRDKMGDEKTQEIMFALDEAEESVDRIEDFASQRPTVGNAIRMAQLGVNEAETAKNAMRDALRVLERPYPAVRGRAETRPAKRIDEPDGVWALQSAMDSDWGINYDKIDFDIDDVP